MNTIGWIFCYIGVGTVCAGFMRFVDWLEEDR